MVVVGKTSRTKDWVSSHKIGSFSDLEASSGSEDDDESGSETEAGGSKLKNSAKNGKRRADEDRASLQEDGSDEDSGPNPANAWDAFEDLARQSIATSKTGTRTAFLNEVLARHLGRNTLAPQQLSIIVKLLIFTYPRYIDSRSRDAVLHCLSQIIVNDLAKDSATKSKLTEYLVKWLDTESTKICGSSTVAAGSTMFNLLTWVATLITVLGKSKTEAGDQSVLELPTNWNPLMRSLALTYNAILACNCKPSVKKSATMLTRRVLRALGGHLERVISTLTSAVEVKPALVGAPLLGCTVDVALRLKPRKNTSKDNGRDLVLKSKETVLKFYRDQLLGSRILAEPQILSAFHDFIAVTIGVEDLEPNGELVKAMDRSLMRSPEAAFTTLDNFFRSYVGPVILNGETLPRPSIPHELILTKMVPAISSSAKSTNPITRSSCVQLLDTLLASALAGDRPDPAFAMQLTKDLATPLKSQKTASPEHRLVLANLVGSLVRSSPALPSEVLTEITRSLTAGLGKENNEQTLKVILRTLGDATAALLKIDAAEVNTIASSMVKGMQDTKPNYRHIYLAAVGDLLWTTAHTQPATATQLTNFVKTVTPGLETAFKNAVNSPAVSAADGWIALAVVRGPLSKQDLAPASLLQAARASTYLNHHPKPSYLLAERGFRKPLDQGDEIWLCRAIEGVLRTDDDLAQIGRDPQLQAAFVGPIVYLATESAHHDTRVAALDTVRTRSSSESAGEVAAYFLDGLVSGLLQAEKTRTMLSSVTDDQPTENRSPRFEALLTSIARAAPASETLLVRLLVPSHHTLLGKQTMWVDALRASKIDPASLVAKRLEALMGQIWQNATHSSSMLRDAAFSAISTLALISPELVLPLLRDRVVQALDATKLSSIGEVEVGIFRTPPGTTYIDVLKKGSERNAAPTKGKNAAMEKWDQETRAALAAKKSTSATPVLSKADRALVEAQLTKEERIRAQVLDTIGLVQQALRIARSLATATFVEVNEIFPIVTFALIDAARSKQCELFAEDLFQTILKWYEASAQRLADIRLSLSLAVLRGEDSPVVPTDFGSEDLAALTLRVLYRLRFQSEKKPFDSSTFTLAYPLLAQCIRQEGLGLKAGDADAVLEQITLTVDIFTFHASEFSSSSFPRLRSIQTLIGALKHFPSLGRQASEALISIGKAISGNATIQEREALMSGLLTEESQVRQACLSALTPLDLTDLEYSNEVWIAVQDSDERNAQLAATIWEDNGLDVTEDSLSQLLPALGHPTGFVRSAAALALAEVVVQLPSLASKAIAMLSDAYHVAARERLPQHDEYGMLIEASLHQEDPWPERIAIAEALEHLAPQLAAEDVQSVFDLLIRDQALGDRSEAVRTKMLESGTAIIDARGKENLQHLMDTFQGYLSQKTAGTEAQDRITEAVIVLLGRLARHLDGNDERMLSVIDRLLAALHTPSEVVQDAVCDCLPPLVKANREKGNSVIEHLLRETLNASRYAERRGAAYGLAGAVKGRGISALKEFDIITRLSDAAEDKKNANAREGAMFAFETMSAKLGRLFEPYIVKVIPLLLTCLGDSDTGVRQATSDAARVIMSKVSGHGVKMILPALLDALEDRQWRSKKGAIELMGNMAYLAPRQLSLSLPSIIPPLTEVLTDTHAQVRSSANASLKKFGDVVDNPEIKAMQSILLGALVDPTKKTLKALDTLLTTSFVHYIDTSSLALVVPIIERGLRERSAELKRKGAQIVGNLASLTDSKDLIAYLPQLIPRVREVLVDPVPEARATAAKSLGILVERLGEDAFPTMVTDLMTTLKSDMSGVDQQGAAQGLSEVLSGLGIERMESMLPEIISCTTSPRAFVREGFISLLIYLPSVFGDRFAPYLGRIIQPILNGLADESDFVREASMRAGRMIVNNHATKAIDLLLPELERGLFDQSWRIRLSSIQLVGELLFRISGISTKAEFEDENAGEEEDAAQPSNTEAARKMLEVLGKDKRDRVLASIYVLRQDSAGQVRLFSINVWKVLVSNTPRTVRETLPSLMQIIIRLLAAPGAEQREMVARTLAELCRKQGDRILGDIIPILQQASKGSLASRQGCCLAFAEMLDATNKTQLEGHEDSIIESVRTALVDEEPSVRQAAALAFDALQTQLGPRSIDQTIPTLLNALTAQGAASDAALSALEELMSVRAHAIFPILIPTLIATPISAFNAKALSSLVTVAGSALNRRLSQILDALQKSAETESDAEVKAELESAIRSVLASIHDTDGLHMLMLHLLGMAKDPRSIKRVGGCTLFAAFCQVTEEDFSSYHVDWLRQLLSLYDDSDAGVIEAAARAMDAFSKTLTKEQMEGLSVALRRSVESMGSPGTEIAGFAAPGALKPVLPILIQGLLAGTNEQREQSAFGLGDIVERTAVDALKPYVTQITGPLIRIIAERYPAPVKAAILSTLTVLLTRVPQFVRPFFPQLQRTFVKNLSDTTSSSIRNRAAAGLGVLMGLQPRIDPLITELVNGAGHDEPEVRDAMVHALGAVVASGGANMGPAARELVANLVSNAEDAPGLEAYNSGLARTLAAMVQHSMQHAEPLLNTMLETKATHFNSISLAACVERAPQQLYSMAPPSKVVGRILKNVVSDVPGVTRPAREAREMLKKVSPWSEDEEVQARLA